MVALITGGDSGIGRAVAVLFAREGADVAIVYLDEHDDAEETQALRRGRGPPLPADPRRREGRGVLPARGASRPSRRSASSTSWSTTPPSRSTPSRSKTLTDERFDETLRTNVYGYFHMAQAALPHLKQGASIINTGSVTGLEGSAQLLDYSTTKGAIHAFTKSLAQQPDRQGHPRQRGRAGAGVDAAEPGRQAGREGGRVRQAHRHEARRRSPRSCRRPTCSSPSPVCSGYITGIVLPVTGSVGAI